MSLRVMVVDDALFMRTALRRILTEAGFDVIAEAENGSQAVECYQQAQPDVVAMDITMPIMDGLAALKEIRAKDPQASVVMCTAMGQQRLVMEALQAGAKDYITKPFQASRVVSGLRKAAGLADAN
ncbi:MAG TPA: response regulator [Armatimonadota bacterium]|nr:response regulator [Armatimonadota bacterium]